MEKKKYIEVVMTEPEAENPEKEIEGKESDEQFKQPDTEEIWKE
jgi:hypothetical protein